MQKILFFLGLVLASITSAQVTLTMGGDVNFNKSLMKPSADGFIYESKAVPFSSYTRGIKNLINGDLNFANIETVVSDREDLTRVTKAFNFVTHPEAIKHLAGLGFNLFNQANNHAFDFGVEGMQETLNNFAKIKTEYPNSVSFGVGYKHDLLKPIVFEKNGFTFAIASVSILDKAFKATENTLGLIHVWDRESYRELLKNMRATNAHYKILSIHYGIEGQVTLDEGQKEYYEYAIKNGDVDLIIGHHPHAVRPIEKIGDRYIFYSLGNYLMLGSANITEKEGGADFGLFAKLHLVPNEKGRLVPEAVELVPLTNTHATTRPLAPEKAIGRLQQFQNLSINQLGNDSLVFDVRESGKGLFCNPVLKLDSSKKACQ